MNKYEHQKKELVKNLFQFDLNDNLINLAQLVVLGRELLKDNNCEELINKLDAYIPSKRAILRYKRSKYEKGTK